MSKKLIKEMRLKVKSEGADQVKKELEGLENVFERITEEVGYFDDALKQAKRTVNQLAGDANRISIGGGSSELEADAKQMVSSLKSIAGSSGSTADYIKNTLRHEIDGLHDTIQDTTNAILKFDSRIEGMTPAQKKAARALGNTTRQGRNQVRTFSDIAKVAGPIPLLYAGIAANVFALSEGFRVMNEAASLNRLENVGSILTASMGAPIQSLARDMQEASGYALTYEEALKQTASAATYGFDATQLNEMTIAARRASVALGVDMPDAMARITRGITKLEPELIDELGITVRLSEAYETYATSLNKSATSLTGLEKQQAYYNAVIEESAKKQGKLDKQLQANSWEALGASVAGASRRTTQYLAEGLEPVAKTLKYIMDLTKGAPIAEVTEDTMGLTAQIQKAIKEGDKPTLAALIGSTDQAKKVMGELGNEIGITMGMISAEQYKMSHSLASFPAVMKAAWSGDEAKKAMEAAIAKEKELIDALKEGYKVMGVSDEAGAKRVKNIFAQAKATADTRGEYDKLINSLKGTQQPFEKLVDLQKEVTVAHSQLAGASAEEYIKLTKYSKEEAASMSRRIALGREIFLMDTHSAEMNAKLTEEARKSGEVRARTATKRLDLALKEVDVQIELAKEIKANGSVIETLEAKRQGLILDRINKEREAATAELTQVQNLERINLTSELFNTTLDNRTGRYLEQKALNEQALRSAQQQLLLAAEQGKSIEDRAKHQSRIVQLQKEGIALDKQNMLNKFSEETGAVELGASMQNIGPIYEQTQALKVLEQQAEQAYAKWGADSDLTRAKQDEALAATHALSQAQLEQAATLDNLFLARTGQQSTAAMGLEQELAYQQEIGASAYENARSALDSFDPAMGAMFDGLQSFTVALNQVGETSQGVWNGVSSGIQAAAGVMSFMSKKAVADIDKQISAEKKRDGKSAASKKKIAQLEAKKQKENEKQQRAAIIANTAVGIMNALATSGNIYAGIALSAVVAGMGAMQLSALDSGSISDPSGAGNIGKLELGSRQNKVNVGQAATGGELSYMRGSQGTGGIQDFVPRATGGVTTNYVTGEHGVEVVSSSSISNKLKEGESEFTGKATSNAGGGLHLTVNALDAQSIIDRGVEIFEAVEAEANNKGFTLNPNN